MIHGYHTDRDWTNPTRRDAKFWFAKNGRLVGVPASEAGRRMYSGLEWEISHFPTASDAVRASDFVDETIGDYCTCQRDGSLHNGFEIVFDPMTLGAFELIRDKLEIVAAEMTRRGGHAHDTDDCGLHVHISRCAIGNDEHAQLLALGKVFELCERFQREFSAFARRDVAGTYYAQPTRYGYAIDDGSRKIERKAKAVQDRQGIDVHDDHRYCIWNLQNRPTIECRAPKGTLKVSTMFATIAFVNGIVRYCMTHTTPDVHAASWTDLINWIDNADLTAYWETVSSRVTRYSAYRVPMAA